MNLNETHKEEIAFLVKHSDKNLPEILRMFAKEYHTKQLMLGVVVGRSEQFSLDDMKQAYDAGENNAGSYTYPPFEEWFRKR